MARPSPTSSPTGRAPGSFSAPALPIRKTLRSAEEGLPPASASSPSSTLSRATATALRTRTRSAAAPPLPACSNSTSGPPVAPVPCGGARSASSMRLRPLPLSAVVQLIGPRVAGSASIQVFSSSAAVAASSAPSSTCTSTPSLASPSTVNKGEVAPPGAGAGRNNSVSPPSAFSRKAASAGSTKSATGSCTM
ncbi:hypothetical protein [Rugamonas sp. DEMB1]|uniref:hypothetical protein n=1 Tax=Rugamonas sp. DEMB1 TaxID=3039386 RepID=UPI002448E9D0|nr:hypothetical protein [Rugamonas sp. DEMB1]WGG48214.1 hypothetical protein QC826_15895 [Rugamonas sp. DEMB1]